MDDDAPPPRPKRFQPPDTERWSVEELRAYIGEMQTEIGRVEAEIAKKDSVRAGADALFKR